MEKIRVAIIGCGGIANNNHMPCLKQVAECEMVAFCDIIKEKAQKAAEEFGVANAKVTTDYMEIANDPDIDVVHVCTPNRSHSFITVACLKGGKHVMCENPMAKTAAEAKEMLDAAKETGKKLTVAYHERHTFAHKLMREKSLNGDFGEIYYAKAHALRQRGVATWGVFINEYEQGGGPLIDIGSQALDLTLWTMNNYEPSMVVGNSFRKLADTAYITNGWGEYDPKDYTAEDAAFSFIKMKNGATIVLESSWLLNVVDQGEACTTLCGTVGGATTLNDFRIMEDAPDENGKVRVITRKYEKEDAVKYYEENNYDVDRMMDSSEARQWIKAIIEDKDPCVLPEQAYVVSQIIDAIYESARTNAPVFFD